MNIYSCTKFTKYLLRRDKHMPAPLLSSNRAILRSLLETELLQLPNFGGFFGSNFVDFWRLENIKLSSHELIFIFVLLILGRKKYFW